MTSEETLQDLAAAELAELDPPHEPLQTTYARGFRMPSASKLQLAATCPASAVLPRVREETDAATAGTWKHAFVQAVAGGADVEAALAQVPEEWRAACQAVDVDAVAPCLASLSAEVALAYDVVSGRARLLSQDLERRYGDVARTEVPMSVDYAAVVDGVAVALDLKTGKARVPGPARNWQLRANALALARLHGVDRAVVGLALALEDEKPRWQSDELDAFELEVVAEQLRALHRKVSWAAERIDSGAPEWRHLTVGGHCGRCPARFGCPAQVALVRRLATEPAKWADETRELLTPETAADAWHRIKAVRRLLDGMEAAIFLMAAHQPVALGGGVELRQVTTEREEIDGARAEAIIREEFGAHARVALELATSKAGIARAVRAAGTKRGELGAREKAVLQRLRAAGAVGTRSTTSVREVERERLRPGRE